MVALKLADAQESADAARLELQPQAEQPRASAQQQRPAEQPQASRQPEPQEMQTESAPL